MTSIKCFVCSMKNGLMTYWDEVEEAAAYHVHLLIGMVLKEFAIYLQALCYPKVMKHRLLNFLNLYSFQRIKLHHLSA